MEAFSLQSAFFVLLILSCCSAVRGQDSLASPFATTENKPSSETKVALPPGTRGPFAVESLQSGPRLGPNEGTYGPDPPKEFEAAKIIARIGDDVILAGDLMGQINQFLHQRLQQIPEEQRSQIDPDMLDEQRKNLMKQLLPQTIEGKLLYLDFLRTVPKENLPDIEDSLYKAFDEQQLPNLIERSKLNSAADLDVLLRSFGSSVSQQRRAFAEQLAAAQWRQRNSADDREVSHQDLIDYYREHIDEYRIEAKVKWEQLSALNAETGSESASYELVAKMGNEVHYGAAFDAVAKRSSQGPTASLGGAYDWTTKGSLRSTVIDEAIFSLPVGSLSKILKDRDGCHIIRVVERQKEGFVPFSEAQAGIRDKIKEERGEVAYQDYIAKLRKEFPVWTVFDDEESVARRNQ